MRPSRRIASDGGAAGPRYRPWPAFKSPPAGMLELRADRWENHLTGIGSPIDKTAHGRFFPVWRILDQELTSLHNGSDLAAKAVEKRPTEMWREGFEATADNVTESEVKDVLEYCEEQYDFEHQFVEADIWARLYGGGLLILGIDDGGMPWEPVNEDRIRSVDWVAFVDRRFAYVQSQYSSLASPRGQYGRPEIYLVANAVAGTGWSKFGPIGKVSPEDLSKMGANISLVHESRCIRFDGHRADVLTRQQLAGWNWSVLQRVYDAMRQFEHAFDSVGYLLSDASQAVYKIQGLFKAISAGRRDLIMQRAMLMEQTRSVMRGILLDAGDAQGKNAETFERQPTPFGGIHELLTGPFQSRLAAAFDMPATELFGRAPAGMNATGESDTRKWYDTIRSEAKVKVSPKIRKLLRYVAISKQGPLRGRDVKWHIEWRPLWSSTDKEVSDVELANAQRDTIYVADGVVKPEEVAVGLKDVYPDLDVDARKEALGAGESFEPYENDPEPETGEPLSAATPVPQIVAPGKGPPPPRQPIVGPRGQPKPAVPAKATAKGDAVEHWDSADIADDVYEQLKPDYPATAIAWTKAVPWSGPMLVPLKKIDFSGRAHWSAAKDDIAPYKKKIQGGQVKPMILIKRPGSKMYFCVDGHHRLLSYEALGRAPLAYVAKVSKDYGPWDGMHALQDDGTVGSDQKPSSPDGDGK